MGDRTVRRFARRPELRVSGAHVTDRLTGRGPVTLLGSRLLAKEVHPGWLPGALARSGAWMRGMPAAALWRMGRLDRSRAPCLVAPRDDGDAAAARRRVRRHA